MCGIVGIIDSKQSHQANMELLNSMLKVQHHRGPDATGTWTDEHIFLGHNRLSIIDLSEAGNQPMHYKSFSLLFNGEIYNYIELKKELEALGHVFVSHCDSEVIPHAFEEWGTDCVKRFVGMWAFIIWDKKNQSLFASRDRFGIKPFYYLHEGERFVFASEIKTLKSSPLFSNDINVAQVSRGLQMGWLGYHDETYYTKVKALPAAHNLIFDKQGIRVERYWDIETGQYSSLSFEEKCDTFYNLFADSIRIHMRSDVPVASCLSGGLDSSAIVSMVQVLHPGMKYKSFSIYYEGDGDVDERPFIREVIKKYPAIEPHYFSPSEKEVQQEFHKALYHADVPVTGSSFISQYFLMQLIAKNGIKVVLDGQGADEYLAGYMHSFYRLIAGMLRSTDVAAAFGETIRVNRRINNSATKTGAHFAKSLLSATKNEQQLYALEYSRYYPFLSNTTSSPAPFILQEKSGSRLDQFLYHLLFTTSLPSLLHYEDRNSMAFSIESRVPFLDHRLVEFAFTLHDDDKIKKAETKYILRESLKRILPAAIYARKDKKGFVTPGENKWLRGPLNFLLNPSHQLPGFINKEKANRIFADYKNGDNSKATLVWRLATLGEWLKS
ncbi:MAG: asparagine synthase (glutamine-hydrolyzing) [Bacteroidota bacterium]|nr:asparagine synthase (glutamine-hydrolyzing) [Bacteroidota bacterium]